MASAALARQRWTSTAMPSARATLSTSCTTARASSGPCGTAASCPTAQPVTAHRLFSAALNATFSQIVVHTSAAAVQRRPAASSMATTSAQAGRSTLSVENARTTPGP
ncbi:hypothetical protein D9M70_519520 [compost metagenome]